MTMQVGMVGTDGVLIASDTKWHTVPRVPRDKFWLTGRYTFNRTKIIISHERGVAISCAVNMETAEHVAREIIRTLPDPNLADPIPHIKAIGQRVLDVAQTGRQDATCLIALMHPIPQLLLFTFGVFEGIRGPVCQRMDDRAFAGDNVNPAMFWAERYYKKLPVKELVPLAAHLIITAHHLNNGSIGGLEIVFCDQSGFHRLSDDSILELEAKSREWDTQIEALLLGHKQEFTYAPNVIR